MSKSISRRSFLTHSAVGATMASLGAVSALADEDAKPKIQGFDETETDVDPNAEWRPFTDRKLKVGIVGFGLCQFGAQFGLQDHPMLKSSPSATCSRSLRRSRKACRAKNVRIP